MRYLSAAEILLIHSAIIDETGGLHGVRDLGLVESAAKQPRQSAFGAQLYPTIHKKAAVYIHAVIFGHAFLDGNKRTAMTVSGVFLEDNGYSLVVPEGEIERVAVAIVVLHWDIPTIATWLEENTKKTR